MQRLEVSGAVRLIYKSLGFKGLIDLISSPNTHCLLSCRKSEKKNFISWVRNAMISYLPGKKEAAFLRTKIFRVLKK